jgi:hypothetical protein
VPEWYTIIKIARYLGIAPWELLEQPECWYLWALDAHNAEVYAENARNKKK